MPFQHALQASRFELKYIIDEQVATGVRDFVMGHLEPDEHARPEDGNAYPLTSLYMDTPDLMLYGQTIQGIKNRFKLRIRFYDNDPDQPAFMEIKRRVTDVICKERAMVSKQGVFRMLNGEGPNQTFLWGGNGNAKSGSALLNFCNLCDTIGAIGCCYVSYVREAYVSPNSNQVRVTFDRQLMGSPYPQGTGLIYPTDGARPNVGGVILELKFTDRFPGWMHDVVQAFNLQRTSVPKYIHCVNSLGIGPGQGLNMRLGMLQ
ncbi:MAG: polyphosphate polymerase domain-containing protein [Pirellulales bacterium]|nr:polyphosphate polymerase domain-containing protein [Pirellulales bacterium]